MVEPRARNDCKLVGKTKDTKSRLDCRWCFPGRRSSLAKAAVKPNDAYRSLDHQKGCGTTVDGHVKPGTDEEQPMDDSQGGMKTAG